MSLSKARHSVVAASTLGYKVLDDGTVLNTKTKQVVRGFLVKSKRPSKYRAFRIVYDGHSRVRRVVYVHMLQAYQMYGDSWLYGSLVIRHKNGDSTDNSTQNIELGTVKENANDVPEHEKVRIARLAVKNLRKLTVEDVRAIRKQRISGIKLIDLADRYGVHFTTIDKICSGRTYTWVD